MDLGFKTYNPGSEGSKWFKDYNFSNVILTLESIIHSRRLLFLNLHLIFKT